MQKLFMSHREANWIEGLERRVNKLGAEHANCSRFRLLKRRKLWAEFQDASLALEDAYKCHRAAIEQLMR